MVDVLAVCLCVNGSKFHVAIFDPDTPLVFFFIVSYYARGKSSEVLG